MEPLVRNIALVLSVSLLLGATGWAEDDGFVPILDKDHTEGWKQSGGGKVTVVDGVASTVSPKGAKPGGYWFQKRVFGDFILKLEFSFDTTTANSGIFFRFPGAGGPLQGALDGYQIDIRGENTGAIYFPIHHHVPPSQVLPLTPGQWIECEVTAIGQHITVKLNGQLVNDYTGDRQLTGYIGLQTEQGKGSVHFRQVRIKELLPAPAPSVPAAPAVAGGGVTPERQATAAELVQTYRNSLVFVTGKNGAGSGFLAHYGTGSFLFTNAHVAAGVKGAAFKTLDGKEVKVGSAACAVDHDVFLYEATPQGKPLEVMLGVDEHAAIGDEIVVLGNAEGAGVINTITGKIVGLGPQLVEVDAPFQPGNSGSPIIHLKSGKVIGLATYASIRNYDTMTKERISKPVVRRFGYRLDSIKSWQQITWPTFSAQAAEMDAIEKLTGDLGGFIDDMTSNSHGGLGTHDSPDVKSRLEAWLEARAKALSQRDATIADQSLLSFMNVVCQGDVKGARPHITYDYFQRELAGQQKERDEIQRVFTEIVRDAVVRKSRRGGK